MAPAEVNCPLCSLRVTFQKHRHRNAPFQSDRRRIVCVGEEMVVGVTGQTQKNVPFTLDTVDTGTQQI